MSLLRLRRPEASLIAKIAKTTKKAEEQSTKKRAKEDSTLMKTLVMSHLSPRVNAKPVRRYA